MSYSIDDKLFIDARTASVSLNGNLELNNYITLKANGDNAVMSASIVPYNYTLANYNVDSLFGAGTSLKPPSNSFGGSNILLPYAQSGTVRVKKAYLSGAGDSNLVIESADTRTFTFANTQKTFYDTSNNRYANFDASGFYFDDDQYTIGASIYAIKDFIYFSPCNVVIGGYYQENTSPVTLNSNASFITSNILPLTNFQYNYFLISLDPIHQLVNWSKAIEGFQNTNLDILDIKLVSCCPRPIPQQPILTFACYVNTANAPVRILNNIGTVEETVTGTAFNNSRLVVVSKLFGSNIMFTSRVIPENGVFLPQNYIHFAFNTNSDISLYLKNTIPSSYRIFNPDNSLFTTNEFTSVLIRYNTSLERRWQVHIDSVHDTVINPLQPLRTSELLVYTTNFSSNDIFVYNSDQSIYETIPADPGYVKTNAYIIYGNDGNVKNVSYSKYSSNINTYSMGVIGQNNFIKTFYNHLPTYIYNDPFDNISTVNLTRNVNYVDLYGYTGASEFKLVRVGENIDKMLIAADTLEVQGSLKTLNDSLNIKSGLGNATQTVTTSSLFTLAQQNITTTGKSVLLIATGVLQPNTGTTDAINLQFYRNAVAIGRNYPNVPNANTLSYHAFAMHYVDKPAASNYTYSLRAQATVGSMKVGYANTEPNFTVIELI